MSRASGEYNGLIRYSVPANESRTNSNLFFVRKGGLLDGRTLLTTPSSYGGGSFHHRRMDARHRPNMCRSTVSSLCCP
jgi:hypothetical protein